MQNDSIKGTKLSPTYYEGPVDVNGDVHLHQRYFTYETELGLVSGCEFSVMFTIDRRAKDVWPHFQDFNIWQNPHGYYYSGVVGELEGRTFHLGTKPNQVARHQYEVVRVIPEHAIVITQPIPEDGTTVPGLPGIGGVSPGFHVFTLNEHNGKTVFTGLMEHASRTLDLTEDQALTPWREMTPKALLFWRDSFIPTLKARVYGMQ